MVQRQIWELGVPFSQRANRTIGNVLPFVLFSQQNSMQYGRPLNTVTFHNQIIFSTALIL